MATNTRPIADRTTLQTGALPTAVIAVLTAGEVASLNTRQIDALRPLQLATFTSQQAAILNAAQLASLSSAAIAALSTTQAGLLSVAQVAALTWAQIQAMSTDQIAAFPTPFHTPVMLDLDGDGISTLGLDAGVRFDMLAAGAQVATGWAGPADGLLALDRNGDGRINDGGELFGAGTTLAGGAKARHGYQAMAELDSNGDGRLSAGDHGWGALRVWVDSNSDGVSQAAELRTLEQLHISQLSLATKQEMTMNNGNIVGLSSTYQSEDGASHAAADVWFAGSSAVPGKGAADLRGSVTGLVEALSSYAHAAPASTGGALAQGGAGGARIDMAACVAHMADQLAGFGAASVGAGLQRPGQAPMAGPDRTLRPPGWHDGLAARAQGWLAAVK